MGWFIIILSYLIMWTSMLWSNGTSEGRKKAALSVIKYIATVFGMFIVMILGVVIPNL